MADFEFDFELIWDNVRRKTPLIHNITNYVTVNDCANILLACGASPIMADEAAEAAEITAICDGLNINIGTLNQGTVPAMFCAGRRACELGHPIILDPVGAGASRLRTDTALKLMTEIKPTVIRGNVSEIKTLLQGAGNTRGVDAGESIDSAALDGVVKVAQTLSAKTGAVIAVTGVTDIIAGANRTCLVRNGRPMMSRVTGTGCMLSALTAALAAANPDKVFDAVCAAVIAMGLCGEIAERRLSPADGNSTYRNYLIDAMYNLTTQQLKEGAKYEMG